MVEEEKQFKVGDFVFYKRKDVERLGIVTDFDSEDTRERVSVKVFGIRGVKHWYCDRKELHKYTPKVSEILPFVTGRYFEPGTVFTVEKDYVIGTTQLEVGRTLAYYGLSEAGSDVVTFDAGANLLNALVTGIKEGRNISKAQAAKELSGYTGEVIKIID